MDNRDIYWDEVSDYEQAHDWSYYENEELPEEKNMYRLKIGLGRNTPLSYDLGIKDNDNRTPLELYCTKRSDAVKALQLTYENLCKTIKVANSCTDEEKGVLVDIINEVKNFKPYLELLIRKKHTFTIDFSKRNFILKIDLYKLSKAELNWEFGLMDKEITGVYNCCNDSEADFYYYWKHDGTSKDFESFKELPDIEE